MIYLIIPAYNEEKNIKGCIAEAAEELGDKKHRFIVVNDGSRDKTLKVVKDILGKYPITIVNHETNKGVAAVIRSGVTRVIPDGKEGDIVFVIEGDGTSDCGLLGEMTDKLEAGYDVVIASRYLPGGAYKNFPIKRWILSKTANILFRIIFPSEKISDYTIFFRGYSYNILKRATEVYGDKLISMRYFEANTELLVKLMKLTDKIAEVAFVYDYGYKKGKSSLNIRKNLVQYWKLVVDQKLGSGKT